MTFHNAHNNVQLINTVWEVAIVRVPLEPLNQKNKADLSVDMAAGWTTCTSNSSGAILVDRFYPPLQRLKLPSIRHTVLGRLNFDIENEWNRFT